MAENVKVVASNRKAYHEYHVEETQEAGMVLTGSEIKSVRAGSVNLRESYALVRGRELWLLGAHIAPYNPASRQNPNPTRDRKLLMHRGEILRLMGRVQEKGLTLVPLRVYLKNNRAKVEIGLVRGKKQYDKRQTIAKREADREMDRAVKERRRK